MSDRSFTLLEIHLGDGHIQFGPKSLRSGTEPDEETAIDSDTSTRSGTNGGRRCLCPLCDDGCDCAACKVAKAVAVLGVLVAVAFAAWKLLGDADLDAAEELDDLAE